MSITLSPVGTPSAYISSSDIEERLGDFTIPAPWTTEANLNALIEEMSSLVENVTGQKFETASRTLYVTGNGMSKTMSIIHQTTWPILSVTSIHRRQSREDAYDLEIESTAYEIAPSRHSITLDYPWKKSVLKNYKVVAVLGAYKVPELVVTALVLLCQERMVPGTIDGFDGNFTSEKYPDGYSYTRPSGTAKVRAGGATTGYPLIDKWLAAHRVTSPITLGLY
jgi:hypothetical protein